MKNKSRILLFLLMGTFLLHQAMNAQHIADSTSTDNTSERKDSQPKFEFVGPYENENMIQQIGRVECIITDPFNDDILYAGANTGGLWRCNNVKAADPYWECITDDYFGMGVFDIAIHPEKSNIIYVVTGLHANGLLNHANYSLGVFKTTDKGKTWINVLAFAPEEQIYTTALEMDPNNPEILYALERKTVYKSTDAGLSWIDLKLDTDPNVVFYNQLTINPKQSENIAISGINGMYISTNGGSEWQRVENLGHPEKTVIAIDYDREGILYAFYEERKDRGTIKKSENNGKDWIMVVENKNLTIRNYIFTIKIAPNGNIYAGGRRIYKSVDGGQKFYHQNKMHDDIRDIYFPGQDDTFGFMATDGGVVIKMNSDENNKWYSCNGNLSISQSYSVSISEQYADLIFTGTHDCGTLRNDSSGWRHVYGSDGGITTIDPYHPDLVYAASGSQYVNLGLSKNMGNTWSRISRIATHDSPVIHHPSDSGTIYLATRDSIPATPYTGGVVRKSDNYGKEFSDFTEVVYGNIYAIAVHEPKPRIAYFAKYHAYPPSTSLYRTRNNGITWKEMLKETEYGKITGILIDPDNAALLWICFANFDANNKIWYSNNEGRSWNNYSDGLPNVPINKLIMDKQEKTLFAATHAGVYTRTPSETGWFLMDKEMPQVLISDVKINYTTRELYVATYGRGIWKAKLKSQGANKD